jgi:rod shape-determining protein MreD
LRRWLAAAAVVVACAVAPLFAPESWAQRGAFPDLAALVVLYLAIQGTPERAAFLGMAIGLLRCVFTPDPTGLDAALYGALGWSGAHFGRAVFQDRATIQMAASAAGVLLVRGAAAVVMALTAASAPGAAGTHGMRALTWISASLFAALATGLAAPVVFSALSGTRVLAGFEKRRLHDV